MWTRISSLGNFVPEERSLCHSIGFPLCEGSFQRLPGVTGRAAFQFCHMILAHYPDRADVRGPWSRAMVEFEPLGVRRGTLPPLSSFPRT